MIILEYNLVRLLHIENIKLQNSLTLQSRLSPQLKASTDTYYS
jgi:hypothetical protein